MVDVNTEIRRTVDTGKVFFGTRKVEKTLLVDTGKLVIVSSNTPKLIKEKLNHLSNLAKIPLYVFNGNARELGNICGKPFVISSMIVKDTGKSKILTAITEKEKTVEKDYKKKSKRKEVKYTKKAKKANTEENVKKEIK